MVNETSVDARFDETDSPGFDRMAEEYDRSRGEYPAEYVLKGLQLVLGDEFASIPGANVLDAGAGTGQISAALLGAGATVTGIDISPSMLEIAKQRCAEFENFTSLVGDLCVLPFEDNSFDFITSRWVMEFIPDWPKAVREMRRVLKPGGTMVLIFTHNMLNTTVRDLFEQVARKRGAPVGFPGATHRLLESYLVQQGAEITDITPEELFWNRELPLDRTLFEFRSRMINHLFQISDDEYKTILDEVESIIAKRHPEGLIDRPTVVTRLWRMKFTREPGFVSGLKFKAFLTASRIKRRSPRYIRRSAFLLRSKLGMS